MSSFLPVARLSDLRNNRGVEIHFPDKNVEIALYRVGDQCFAINNICPHEHTPGLADSSVTDGYITCPMHGWSFNIHTGKTLNGAKGVKTYRVKVEGDSVLIEEPEEQLPTWSM